jgi:putative hydroxymethylpyrimidine transport system ATP-binding protein
MPRDIADPQPFPEPPAVTVQEASLAYQGVPLFDRLSFALPGGRITCLLGPSGVGKSSLLRLIAGLAQGATGEVHDGQGGALHGRLAYMAQQDLLLPWLTTLDNVLIGYRLRGGRIGAALRDRAHHLLQRVGLGGYAMHRPAVLSGGMRQRAALARTLMEDRPVVLMDEPFSGLDALTRYELQALAADLLEGRTVLLVTHDPLEALRISHRMLVLTGRPATLDAKVQPPDTAVPRQANDSDLLELQAQLLTRLGAPGGLAA